MSFLNRFMEGQPQDDTLHSVIRNLLYLLNSKVGYGSRLRNFGLGDYFGQRGVEAAATSVMHEILYDIVHYEPRLKPKEIFTWDDGRLPLAMELKCELLLESGAPMAKKTQALPCRLLILWDAIHGLVRIDVIDLMSEKELALLQAQRSLPTFGEKQMLPLALAHIGDKDVR